MYPEPPIMRDLSWDGTSFICIVDNLLSIQRCQSLIENLDSSKWTPAKLDDLDATVDLTIRNHGRQIMLDQPFATELFNLLYDYLPKIQVDSDGRSWKLKQINPVMRYLRYKPTDFFAPHYDGATILTPTLQSFITVQTYLTTNPVDGATCFLPDELAPNMKPIRIFPDAGSVLLFEHDLLHQGETIDEGEKLTIRTDVLYELEI